MRGLRRWGHIEYSPLASVGAISQPFQSMRTHLRLHFRMHWHALRNIPWPALPRVRGATGRPKPNGSRPPVANPACALTVTKGRSPFAIVLALAEFATRRDEPLIGLWVSSFSPCSKSILRRIAATLQTLPLNSSRQMLVHDLGLKTKSVIREIPVSMR